MSPKRRRNLSPEEKRLWDKVAQTTTPISSEATAKITTKFSEKKPHSKAVSRPTKFKPIASSSSEMSNERAIGSFEADTYEINRDMSRRIKRGKLRPNARLDLHGMTLNEAHPELISFLLSSSARGDRLALVITGKGKERDTGGPIPARTGALRNQLPVWLRQAPLAAIVSDFGQALPRDGGAGAYYIYLKRRR